MFEGDERIAITGERSSGAWRPHRPAFPFGALSVAGSLAALVTLAACSSSSSAPTTDPAPGSEPTTDGTGPSVSSGRRILRSDADFDSDGIVEQSITYAYDAAGRVTTKTIVAGMETTVIVNEYEDGRLISRTDGSDTESFGYENGRVVTADTLDAGPRSYRYDAAGRLVGITGEAFDYEDDCETVGTSITPEFDIEYTADGRVRRVSERVLGGVLEIERDARGMLARIVGTDCSGTVTQTIEYDERGRAIGVVDDDPEGSFFVTERTFDGELLESVTFLDTEPVEPGVFGGSFGEFVVTYAYDERGLRVSETTRQEGRESVVTVTHEYEDGRCVSEASADPANVLNVELVSLFLDPGPALGCGYWFDTNLE